MDPDIHDPSSNYSSCPLCFGYRGLKDSAAPLPTGSAAPVDGTVSRWRANCAECAALDSIKAGSSETEGRSSFGYGWESGLPPVWEWP